MIVDDGVYPRCRRYVFFGRSFAPPPAPTSLWIRPDTTRLTLSTLGLLGAPCRVWFRLCWPGNGDICTVDSLFSPHGYLENQTAASLLVAHKNTHATYPNLARTRQPRVFAKTFLPGENDIEYGYSLPRTYTVSAVFNMKNTPYLAWRDCALSDRRTTKRWCLPCSRCGLDWM